MEMSVLTIRRPHHKYLKAQKKWTKRRSRGNDNSKIKLGRLY